jgi:hypothetical protein
MTQVPGFLHQVDPIALAVESGRAFKPTEKVTAEQHGDHSLGTPRVPALSADSEGAAAAGNLSLSTFR